ncbi:LTA synthase family protein [Floricoccus penangensis]|uniref:LTA synthase family protein n=1 Tax=Floricoccus penangensis TaxID=1859475 RepID=UPI000A4894F1|nr:LTA synthase family protein [Floricoccus penangensis]
MLILWEILFVGGLILSLLLITVVDVILKKEKGLVNYCKTFLQDSIFTVVISLGILRFYLNKKNILVWSEYFRKYFFLKFLIFLLGIGIIFVLTKYILRKLGIVQGNDKKRGILGYLSLIVSTILFAGGIALAVGSRWFISFFGKLTPEQFLFNFNSPVSGGEDGVMLEIYSTPVLVTVALTVLFITVFWPNIKLGLGKKTLIPARFYRLIALLIGIVTFVYGANYSIKELDLKKVYQAYYSDSSYIKDNYVDPKKTDLKFPTQKRNLVHFYLESYENSFFDKENGGYGYEGHNLMPELMELSKEGIHFSQNETFGGPNQTYGSSWSVASMVNMSTGLPLKIPMDGNSYGKTGYFLPGATAIGDILQKEGYEQTIMFGADANFGGLTSFFTNHGDYNIFDLEYARNSGLIPKDYKVWWGYEDKKLYQYAKDEMTRLYETGKPFNLTMENADTHFPNGYLEPGTPTPYQSQYANVFLQSQKDVVELVRWIQKQPFYENTTIVLTGDHLSMDKDYFKDFDPGYRRSTFNLILNGDFSNKEMIQMNNREYAPFDYFPTVLAAMGVDINGDRLGLGTNLASDTKTLVERDGVDTVNQRLGENSDFYNRAFVSESGENIDGVKVSERKLNK